MNGLMLSSRCGHVIQSNLTYINLHIHTAFVHTHIFCTYAHYLYTYIHIYISFIQVYSYGLPNLVNCDKCKHQGIPGFLAPNLMKSAERHTVICVSIKGKLQILYIFFLLFILLTMICAAIQNAYQKASLFSNNYQHL